MTMPSQEAATNARRAAAILIHYANNSPDGFQAILAELKTSGDSVGLILGLCGMFDTAMPILMTPGGVELVQSVVASLAGVEYRDAS